MYITALKNVIGNFELATLNESKRFTIGDRLLDYTVTPFLAIAAGIIDIAPVPFPGLLANALCGEGFYYPFYWECGFWGVLKEPREAIESGPKKQKYEELTKNLAAILYSNCKTAICSFALSDAYQSFFDEVFDINTKISIGLIKLDGIKMKKGKIRRILKDVTQVAAESKKTAEYEPRN